MSPLKLNLGSHTRSGGGHPADRAEQPVFHATPTPSSTQRSASTWRATVALLLAVALVAAGCTSTAEAPEEEAGDAQASELPATIADGPLAALQDLWIVSRMQAVGADGSTTDVLDEVVAELGGFAETAVPMIDELAFRPVPALAPRMVTATGAPRDSVEVVAGLLEVTDTGRGAYDLDAATPATTLAVVASAGPNDVHVTTGDLLSLEIFDLDVLAGVDTVLIDHVFGQSLAPVAGDVETATADPIALLAERWQDGRVILGSPGDGPDTAAALFVGVPLQRADTVVATPASWQAPQDAAVLQQVSATGGPTDGVGPLAHPVILGGGSGGGFLPAKSHKPLLMTALFEVACIALGTAMSGGAGVVVAVVICTGITAAGAFPTVFELLEDNSPGSPPEPSCDWPCGRSSGDPHLSTYLGEPFTIQAAGEFIAARAPDVGLEVQVRMLPFNDRVAVNGAVALTVGDARVSIDANREELVLVDGEPALTGEFDLLDLGDGAGLERHGPMVVVTWADGSSLWVRARLGSIDYALDLTETAATGVAGLHGTGDGRLQAADGTVTEASADHDQLLRHADTWRITDAESLFDRPPGTSTATWTDLDFPAAPVTLASLDPVARDRARVICLAAGLIGIHLDTCILDVASSGDPSFATSAREIQRLVDPDAPPPALDGFYGAGGSAADQDGEVEVAALAWIRDDVRPLGPGGGLTGRELLVAPGIVFAVREGEQILDPRDLIALEQADGTTRWELSEIANCDPIVTSDGLVVALLEDGTLVSVDPANGTVTDRLPDQGPTGIGCGSGLRAAGDGLVLRPVLGFGTATKASGLRAYDTRDGLTLRWERTFDEDQLATALGADDRVYVIRDRAEGSTLQRLDASSGATLATIDLDVDLSGQGSQLVEGVLIALPGDRVGIFGVDLESGRVGQLIVLRDAGSSLSVDWDISPGAALGSDQGFLRARVLDDRALVGWIGNELAAVDLADGSLLWNAQPSSFQNNRAAITVADDGTIVVAPFGGALLDAFGPRGELRWQIDEIGGLEGVSQVGPVVEGRLFLTTNFGRDTGRDGSGVVAIDIPER